MSAVPLLALVVATSSTSTTTFVPPPDDARDAAMFGEPEPAVSDDPPAIDEPSDDRDADMLGRERGVLDRLKAAAEKADDYLAVGGSLWLWAQWLGDRERAVKDFPLTSPSFMDVYLDARPSDRVRAYSRFRTSYDFTVASGDVDFLGQPNVTPTFALDQLWLKFDIHRLLFVTVGKEPIRWGSGRIWNPTDFLNVDPVDSLAFFDVRLGVPVVKLHFPVESLGWNFYAIAALEGASNVNEVAAAARAEFVFWKAELALSALVRRKQAIRLGADLTAAVWWFDLKAELGVRYDEQRAFYRGRYLLDGIDLLEPPEAVDRRRDLVPQLVLGAEIQVPYSDRDNITFSAEYFFNDSGFEDPSLYKIPIAAALSLPGFEGGSAQAFNPLFLGRHYAALSVVLFGPGDWDDTTFLLNVVASLSDKTVIARLNYSVLLLTYLRLNAFVAVTPGPAGGAFAFELEVPPIPGVFGGLRVPPSLFQLGASLNVSL